MKSIVEDNPRRWRWSLGRLQCGGFGFCGSNEKVVTVERRKGVRWVVRIDGDAVFDSTELDDLLVILARSPGDLLPHIFLNALQRRETTLLRPSRLVTQLLISK